MPGLSELEALLGHAFANQGLVDAALTHGSRQEAVADYQRLEFLGDRVLSLVVAEELYTRFPQEKEGALAARLSNLVRAETCAKIAEQLNVADFIQVGAVEKRKGVQNMASVLGDVIEALIGALYLDGGLAVARRFIVQHWEAMFTQAPASLKDAKTFVQEWALGQAMPLPNYVVLGREGPQHAPRFEVSLQVGNHTSATGQGPSKQAAEMDAATNFISREGLR